MLHASGLFCVQARMGWELCQELLNFFDWLLGDSVLAGELDEDVFQRGFFTRK